MKIHFDNVNFSSRTGPNTFGTRLASRFFELGHDVLDSADDADISLVFIQKSGKPLSKKVVQRLDGIWFKPNEIDTKNSKIKELYQGSDGVVFQSEFDKTMIEKWFGQPRNSVMIHNGINVSHSIKEITETNIQNIRRQYDFVFCCSANWHAQKRLRSNLEAFFHITSNEKYRKSCLIVMGKNPDSYVSATNVFYVGSQPYDVCSQIFSISDWMIHLGWADHCPNTVIESLGQRTPVICTEVGGTKEIVGNFGIILKEEKYDYVPYDYDSPPAIDVTQLPTILPEITENALSMFHRIDLHHCAKKYIDFFEKII